MEISKIKVTLKEKGVSYAELSAMSGIGLNTIKSIFSGRTQNPRIDTMQAIEKALNITDESRKIDELTDDQYRLISAFDKLIPPMQEYVLSMIEGLVAQKQNIVNVS